MSTTFKLSKPLGDLTEITLRDIEAGDYIRLGPVMVPWVDAEGRKRLMEDTKVLKSYITRVSGFTDKQIDAMSLRDFMDARTFVINQLAFGGSSEASTESPSS